MNIEILGEALPALLYEVELDGGFYLLYAAETEPEVKFYIQKADCPIIILAETCQKIGDYPMAVLQKKNDELIGIESYTELRFEKWARAYEKRIELLNAAG